MASGRRVASGARSLVNDRSLHLENAQVLHESLLLPVLMYGSDTMIWKEEDQSRAVHMYNHRVLMGIRRKDKISNPNPNPNRAEWRNR